MSRKLDISEITKTAYLGSRSQFLFKYQQYLTVEVLEDLYHAIRDCVAKKREVNCGTVPLLKGFPLNDPYPLPGQGAVLSVKSIPEDPEMNLKSANQILNDPKLPKKIDKIIAMYKSGFSPDYISKFGKENGFLRTYDTPNEIRIHLRAKGLL